jgi:hypothetical protein
MHKQPVLVTSKQVGSESSANTHGVSRHGNTSEDSRAPQSSDANIQLLVMGETPKNKKSNSTKRNRQSVRLCQTSCNVTSSLQQYQCKRNTNIGITLPFDVHSVLSQAPLCTCTHRNSLERLLPLVRVHQCICMPALTKANLLGLPSPAACMAHSANHSAAIY